MPKTVRTNSRGAVLLIKFVLVMNECFEMLSLVTLFSNNASNDRRLIRNLGMNEIIAMPHVRKIPYINGGIFLKLIITPNERSCAEYIISQN
jgi:hypothetical protein